MSNIGAPKHEVAGPPRQREWERREQERKCLTHRYTQMSRQGQADSGRDTVFSSDGSSCCEAGGSSGSSSSGVGSSHTPIATTPTTPTAPEPARPPRITPFSGVLSQGKAVIRPIAFRPLQGGAMSPGPGPGPPPPGRLTNAVERYGSTPVLARPGARLALHGSTTDLRALHSLHAGGSHLSLDRKLTACASPPLSSLPLPGRYDSARPPYRAGSVDATRALRRLPLVGVPLGGSHHGSTDRVNGDLDLDAAPADLELEAALRGRDSEMAVRQRDGEGRSWARELRRLHGARQRGSQRVRESELVALGSGSGHPELHRLRARLEETEWALHQRNGELSLLKAQLKDAHAERGARAQDVMTLRSENRELRAQLERVEGERSALRRQLSERDADLVRARDARAAAARDASDLRAVARHLESELELAVAKGTQAVKKHAGGCGTADAQQLRSDLRRLQEELAAERAEFELERATWSEEKEKVLRYQRQLQLNYVQMFRRTRALEAEVESLTMELELEVKAHKKAGKIHAHTIEL